MTVEANMLIFTAASIAFLHTILGPDHYLPFTALARARSWSLYRTLQVTFVCGLGHVLSSVVIGAVGLVIGAELASLISIEGLRGSLASWALISFGLVYLVWGLKSAGRDQRHSHAHAHGELVHVHEHDHRHEHMHLHAATVGGSLTPWALFIVFVLGPCEALIPLFMYPAATLSAGLVFAVASVFGLVTLVTMMVCVAASSIGLGKLRLPRSWTRFSQAAAGASIAACGGAMAFLGM